MKLRKTLFIGALFTILVNVNTVGAWANPSAAKTASAHTNSRWAQHRAQKASDSGCPTMSGDSEIAQQDGDLENRVTVWAPGTPCATAQELLEAARKALHELERQRDSVEAKKLDDKFALVTVRLDPNKTAQQLIDAKQRLHDSELDLRDARAAVERQEVRVARYDTDMRKDCDIAPTVPMVVIDPDLLIPDAPTELPVERSVEES